MKKIIIILIVLMPTVVFGQQFPFMEGYSVNPFSLSPAFAGIHNSKTLFVDYRSDWTGLDGGPGLISLVIMIRLAGLASEEGLSMTRQIFLNRLCFLEPIPMRYMLPKNIFLTLACLLDFTEIQLTSQSILTIRLMLRIRRSFMVSKIPRSSLLPI